MKYKILLLLTMSIAVSMSYAQEKNYWTTTSAPTNGRLNQGRQLSANDKFFSLNLQDFKSALQQAPQREQIKGKSGLIISFPNADGIFENFSVVESSVLDPQLTAKYPTIKSYAGQGVEDPTSTIRFSVSEYNGFNGVIHSVTNKSIYIEPTTADLSNYRVYINVGEGQPFKCGVINKVTTVKEEKALSSTARVSDKKIRTYRVALSCAAEYGNLYVTSTNTTAQKKAQILAQMNTVITRISAIYERDLSVTLQIISGTDQLFYWGDTTIDPWPDFSQDTYTWQDYNNICQQVISSKIPASNYDLGHHFNIDVTEHDDAGSAGCIACSCQANSKGLAFSIGGDPSNTMYPLVVAHEMGHQMGAYHTQSSKQCISGNHESEVEPGGGSTIMSYASICQPTMLSMPDANFNYISIKEITDYIYSQSCGSALNLNNNAPTANAGLDYTIPKSTPFQLIGQGSDPDGNTLTYTWEQNDPQDYNALDVGTPPPTKVTGPMFRTQPPSSSPNRYLPSTDFVIANQDNPWEVLPSVSRTLNFAFTVRDNFPGGGQVASDLMVVTVSNAGPFRISSNNAPAAWTPGASATVTWDVAGTNAAPVNCANVKISLSIDSGKTFPYVLSASTANDGTENVTAPTNISSSNCRLKIEAIGNIFYALSTSDFSITAGGCVASAPSGIFQQRVENTGATINWIRGNNSLYEFRYRLAGGSTWITQTVADQPGNYYISNTLTGLATNSIYEAQVHSLCDGGNTITVRARGVTGQEHINIKVGTTIIGSVALTTSYQNYTYQTSLNGGILVQYDNDQGSRDVQVDYVEVNGEIRQAEAQSFNTGAYLNGSCGGGGNSEWLNCNGSIGFDNVNRNNVTIRARGTLGGEHINLRINNAIVANFTLGTTIQNYTATFTATGGITVEFDNDKPNSDVQIDYIIANGITRQAEAQSYNTAFYANGSCGGGGFSEWMNCNGLIGFGNADLPGAGSSNWSDLFTFRTGNSNYNNEDVNTLLAIDRNCDKSNMLNWNTTLDLSTWNGVTWSTTTPKRVLELNLAITYVTGTIDLGSMDKLESFNCGGFNTITDLKLSGATGLKTLGCGGNQIRQLDLSAQQSLTDLSCNENYITSINFGTIKQLVTIDCRENFLTSLNLSSLVNLTEISLDKNYVTSLDVSSLTSLQRIFCTSNALTNITVGNIPNLKSIVSSDNKLTTLTLGNNPKLTEITCEQNLLTSIVGLSNASQMITLDVSQNKFTTLDVSNNHNITTLRLDNNLLTSIKLPTSPSSLQTLTCFTNNLTTLSLTGQAQLKNLWCDSNKLTGFTIDGTQIPLDQFVCSYNNLPFSELYKINFTKVSIYYEYAPQNEVFNPVNSATNVTINYSSQAGVAGQTTTFKWYKNAALVSTNTTGTFTTTGVGVYYCMLTNGQFPDLTLTTAKTTIGNPSARMAEDPEVASINSAPEQVAAYPNPATHSVVIDFSETPSQIALYTTLGAPVVERTVEGSQMILDVSDTKPGIYILKISSGKNTYTQRIVIQH